jgi:hypothetical protein
MSIAAKTKKVCKHIKKPMSIAAKTQKDQKTHEHCSENEQAVQTHQKTMSIAAKTKPNQKTHDHSIQKSQKVLKPMSIAAKTQKTKPRPEQEEEAGNVIIETPSVDNHSPLTRPHSFASPARTHARHEHETKPKPISRLGVSSVD